MAEQTKEYLFKMGPNATNQPELIQVYAVGTRKEIYPSGYWKDNGNTTFQGNGTRNGVPGAKLMVKIKDDSLKGIINKIEYKHRCVWSSGTPTSKLYCSDGSTLIDSTETACSIVCVDGGTANFEKTTYGVANNISARTSEQIVNGLNSNDGYDFYFDLNCSSYGWRFYNNYNNSTFNMISIKITYTPEYFTPTIIDFNINTDNFFSDKAVGITASILLPESISWPDSSAYTTKNLSVSLSASDGVNTKTVSVYNSSFSSNKINIATTKTFDTNWAVAKTNKYTFTLSSIVTFSGSGVTPKTESSNTYEFILSAAKIPLSLSPKGFGVSIGEMTSLRMGNVADNIQDKVENARFECHYPIILYENSYGIEANKPTNPIEGQLYFVID